MHASRWSDLTAFEGSWRGIATGFKYQCVELARRYLIVNHGVTFDSIPMAFNIFDLTSVQSVRPQMVDPDMRSAEPRMAAEARLLKMRAHTNGVATVAPVVGSLLVWKPVGHFKGSGHVAVVVDVDVQQGHVDVVEQNVEDTVWPVGVCYSRRLTAHAEAAGPLTIRCTFPDAEVLGWMNMHLEEPFEYDIEHTCTLQHLRYCEPAPVSGDKETAPAGDEEAAALELGHSNAEVRPLGMTSSSDEP